MKKQLFSLIVLLSLGAGSITPLHAADPARGIAGEIMRLDFEIDNLRRAEQHLMQRQQRGENVDTALSEIKTDLAAKQANLQELEAQINQ